jgi:predicted transport protein
MALYTNQSGQLKEVKEKPFKLERDMQQIFEANLTALMGLELVKSEFTIKNRRIDTLAYDAQSCAFIIIEYKRDKNISVVDQGFTYLSLMLENKADFIVEYNESLRQNMKREDVDWSQTRVAFVSPTFTENQKQATNFKDIAIELWEVKQYENDTIAINPIKKSVAAESIKPITQQTQSLKNVSAEIKVYTEQDHIENASDLTAELYEKFKAAILNLTDGIEVNPQKWYISFKKSGSIAYLELFKKALKITINLKIGQLDDPKKIAKDVSSIGHRGYGDYQIQVDDDKDLEYIMSLVKQAIQ